MQKTKRVLWWLVGLLLGVIFGLLVMLVAGRVQAAPFAARSVYLVAYPLSLEMEDGSVRVAEFLSSQSCRAQLNATVARGELAVGCKAELR